MANKTRVLILGGGFALAHTQAGTRTAPWNREQLSVVGIDDPGCSGVDHARQPGSPPPATVAA
jgi:hypothetical protein